MVLIKRGENLNQASLPARWLTGGNKQLLPPRREKSKLLLQLLFCRQKPQHRSRMGTYKRRLGRTKSFSGRRPLTGSSRPFNTTATFLQCLADDLNSEFILISCNHWRLARNTASKILVFIMRIFVSNFKHIC